MLTRFHWTVSLSQLSQATRIGNNERLDYSASSFVVSFSTSTKLNNCREENSHGNAAYF